MALDHVEWTIIDAKRKEKGLAPVGRRRQARPRPPSREGFDIRQPQHIPLAANLGLGLFDFKIDHIQGGIDQTHCKVDTAVDPMATTSRDGRDEIT